jgi:hypothetical protein
MLSTNVHVTVATLRGAGNYGENPARKSAVKVTSGIFHLSL